MKNRLRTSKRDMACKAPATDMPWQKKTNDAHRFLAAEGRALCQEPSETENLGSLMKELPTEQVPAEHRPCEALGEPTLCRR